MPRTWPALDLHFPAALFGDSGLHDRALALIDDFQPTAIDESASAGQPWRVFFASASIRDAAAAAVVSDLGSDGLVVAAQDVADEAWAEKSQASLRAVRVGRVVVAPPWDLPPRESDHSVSAPITIVINPSMGFGTGHHASTRLCLLALQRLSLDGTTVLDIGTGSGLLAIAAVRLGAASADAIDNDPDALASALENVALNEVGERIRVRNEDVRNLRDLHADVVVANLTAALLERTAVALSGLVRPGGHLVVSGFTTSYEPGVIAVFEEYGRLVKREEEEDGWVALTIVRTGLEFTPDKLQ